MNSGFLTCFHPLSFALLLGATLAAPSAIAREPATRQNSDQILTTPWPATDALGRQLPLSTDVGPPRKDRFVGMFYFLWHSGRNAAGKQPRDISKILAKDPDALRHPNSPLWGAPGTPHYWGEPLYGYYQSADEWVLRRHARLLADAGIDTLIFDTTNAATYPDVYHKLCEVFEKVRQEGGRTPHIAFMVNTQAGPTARKIYLDLYKPGKYHDLWFIWQRKPLLICDPKQADTELKQFFTLRAAHWPFELVNTPCAWHWESTYPQVYGYTDDPSRPEEVNVAVAQNLRAADGKVTNMSEGNARGRSFHDGKEDAAPGAVNHGYNFAEQWKRAIALDPPFVMVTGWNEWIAGHFGKPGGPVVFVDQYNEEFSRDIEPMKGGHGDNYYYQLVANVRRYKGAPPIPESSKPTTIHIAGPFDQWKAVLPEFLNPGDAGFHRDAPGVGALHYTNNTSRNQFIEMKVARDADHVYFYARTRQPLTPRTDPSWMWLLISIHPGPKDNWQGYNYIINRTIDPDGAAWLEKNDAGGWHWKKIAKIPWRAEGNELQLSISKSDLGLQSGANAGSLDFKWADNLQHPGDIMDFYLSGDVAPEGRFMYRYQWKQ